MKKTSWLGSLIALANHAATSRSAARPSCMVGDGGEIAVAVAERDEHRGLTWWFERRDRAGRALGPRIELGWGYDGAEVCALGYQRGRYLATWAWWDPYGLQPELRTAVIEHDRRIATDGRYLGPYSDLAPVAVTPARDGWTIHYRLAPEGDVQRLQADRDGRLQRP